MKYIRTKDGIYEVEEWFKPLENDMVYIPNEGLNKILNKADTIEELCDTFVLTWANQYRIEGILDFCIIMSKDDSCAPKNSIKIYGAIWTDKGLIYVAKMNDKGELELL